jgi:ATP-dependent Clp protease ATP-binding subunit ClpC
VEDALAEEIVASHLQEGDHIKIDLDSKTDELKISIEKAEKPTES